MADKQYYLPYQNSNQNQPVNQQSPGNFIPNWNPYGYRNNVSTNIQPNNVQAGGVSPTRVGQQNLFSAATPGYAIAPGQSQNIRTSPSQNYGNVLPEMYMGRMVNTTVNIPTQINPQGANLLDNSKQTQAYQNFPPQPPMLNGFGSSGNNNIPNKFQSSTLPNGFQSQNDGIWSSYNDFCQEMQQNSLQYALSEELLGKIQTSANKKAIMELQIGFEQIVMEPGEFDTWASVIRDRLSSKDMSSDDLTLAVGILIEMATVLNESQYNYSRLCRFLSSLKDFIPNVLLPQISDFVRCVEQYLSDQHMRNLVVFLSEVYDKIEINGVKPSVLAAHIFDQLLNLLKIEPLSGETVSTITQSLKLIGRFLENDRGENAMNALFEEINARAQAENSLSESSKSKLMSLEALRNNRWGVTETKSTTSSNPCAAINGEREPTDEEFAFLEENLDMINSANESLYPLEEDNNIEEDYEKFLQATAVRAAEKALEKVSFDDDDENSGKFTGRSQKKC